MSKNRIESNTQQHRPHQGIDTTEPSWCVMPAGENHGDHHCGDMVELVDGNGATKAPYEEFVGYYAYAVQDLGQPVEIAPGGDGVQGEGAVHWAIDPKAVRDLLAATATPEARAALRQLVDQVLEVQA